MPGFTITSDWPPTVQWLVALWLFVIGASIGSFLNVVVYRLPRGLSLVHPGSRCPACGHTIRWHDNVPVLGWLMLKGRCRDCRARISPRYPLVEALVGLIFVALAACEIFLVGQMSDAMVWGGYAYHAILVGTLLAAGLMEFDQQRPPLKLFIPAILVGLAAPLMWPDLSAVRLMEPSPQHLAQNAHWLAALEGLAGIGAGLLFGSLAWPAMGLESSKSAGRWIATAELALLGCYLGWQTVPMGSFALFAYFATLMRGYRWVGPRSYDNLSLPMVLVALWGIASNSPLPILHSTAESLTNLIVFGGLVAAASLAVRYTALRHWPSHHLDKPTQE